MNYIKPRLVFKKDNHNPLVLHYGNAYYPGCFTPTGMNDNEDIPQMLEWVKEHNCGTLGEPYTYTILFEDEKQLSWFLLHWS